MSAAHGHHTEDTSSHSARGLEADPPGPTTAFAGAIGVFLIIATIIGLEGFYYFTSDREETNKSYQQSYNSRVALQSTQRADLEKYKLDKETKKVQIPISDAMKMVQSTLKSAPAGGGS